MTKKKLDVSILDFPLNTEPPDQASIDEAVSSAEAILKRSTFSFILIIFAACSVYYYFVKLILISLIGFQGEIPGIIWVGIIILMVTLPISLALIRVVIDNKFVAVNRIEAAKPARNSSLEFLLNNLRDERPDYLVSVGQQGRSLTQGEVNKLTDSVMSTNQEKIKRYLDKKLFSPIQAINY